MEHTIHEQVRKQLGFWKMLVDAENKQEERCKEWGIPYTPSRRKWIDVSIYEEYKREIAKNGDKNLLVMVKLHGEDGINMYGIYPFARRYVYENYLVHRTVDGIEILLKEDEVQVVKG